jgi:hypothetical protein
MRIVLLGPLGAGSGTPAKRIVGESNIFGEASQELSGSRITCDEVVPRRDRYWDVRGTSLGSMPSMIIMDAKAVAREGCRGQAGPCRGNCKRVGSPVDQVSAELAGAGRRLDFFQGRGA